jgi:integrase
MARKLGSVIVYDGARGRSFRIRYSDASGKRVVETLRDCKSEKEANAILAERMTDVRRDGFRKPSRTKFSTFAAEWVDTYPTSAALKRSTESSYKTIVNKHLIPAFGTLSLSDIDVQRIEAYEARAIRQGVSARSVGSHLRVLNLILKSALKQRLIAFNPVALADRPRVQEKEWRILSPVEIVATEHAFDELIEEEKDKDRRDDLTTARAIFITIMGVALRRGEILGLRWRHVSLADPDGACLRVEETYVRCGVDTPKSQSSRRTVALGRKVAETLFELRGQTAYQGDDERVFCNPRTGHTFDVLVYTKLYRKALAKAGITDYVRPFHDGRHTSITNGAKAGLNPAALQARAGHASFSTTQRYISLAGETFRNEADQLERRLWGEQADEKAEETIEAA